MQIQVMQTSRKNMKKRYQFRPEIKFVSARCYFFRQRVGRFQFDPSPGYLPANRVSALKVVSQIEEDPDRS